MTEPNDKPPFFKSWKGVYLFVLVFLAVEIILFTWLSQLNA
jgi:hypothetical protein